MTKMRTKRHFLKSCKNVIKKKEFTNTLQRSLTFLYMLMFPKESVYYSVAVNMSIKAETKMKNFPKGKDVKFPAES